MKALLGLCAVLALAGCKRSDMYTQDYKKTWDSSAFFKDGKSMRPLVAGTQARDVPNAAAAEPARIDQAMLERGQQRFNIFCTPCHGVAGNGQGMIVQRGFAQPPSFVEGDLRTAKAEVFYNAITNGYGAMYSFADRVAPTDRWAIVAYIRALQLSQNADPASLPASDRAQLEAAK